MSDYALVPEGFKLTKVTKTQKQAVKDHYKHEDMVALLSNENAALGIIGLGGVLASGALVALFMDIIKDQSNLSDKEQGELKQSFLKASALMLPINPLVFAPAAAEYTAQRVSEVGVLDEWISFVTGKKKTKKDGVDPGLVPGGKGR